MVKTAIIGCGRISKKHFECIESAKGFSLVGVADLDAIKKTRAATLNKTFGYLFYEDMIKERRPELVAICTEAGFHSKIACEVMNLGCDVLVEKPLALTIEDADSMVACSATTGRKLFVMKQNRFNIPVQRMLRVLDSGNFGKLVSASVRVRWCRRQDYFDMDRWRGTWKDDGGVIASQACHHVDLLQRVLGPIDEVMCHTTTRLLDIPVEDTAVAIWKAKSGALGILEATNAARPKDLEGSISVLGEKGTVVIEGFAVNKLKTWEFEGETNAEECSENPPNIYGFGHKRYYEHIARVYEGLEKPIVDGNEARKTVRLFNAMYHSVECGKWVKVDEHITKCGR